MRLLLSRPKNYDVDGCLQGLGVFGSGEVTK